MKSEKKCGETKQEERERERKTIQNRLLLPHKLCEKLFKSNCERIEIDFFFVVVVGIHQSTMSIRLFFHFQQKKKNFIPNEMKERQMNHLSKGSFMVLFFVHHWWWLNSPPFIYFFFFELNSINTKRIKND